ncbi:uncharacterized protein LOC134248078 [Saccostrea cucullata]|uniref:uncharacterized protein LOC134248078 n=1 Tax=Saccostrea cuccullata TaxID=36930 RepID=UPI002ED3A8EB
MDPLDRAQVLLLCDLCQKAALQSHCELCKINLCKACVGEHLSDSSLRHKVVPYKHRTSTPNVNYPSFIKDIINKDLKELEKRILPTYEEITLEFKSEKFNLQKLYEKLTTAVTKQGEDWHREINIIVNKQKSEINEMQEKHLAALNKQRNEIKQITSDVKQSIFDLKKILDSNDSSLTSAYKPRNAEFRRLPPKIIVSIPRFSLHQTNTEQLHQMFGSLSALSISTEEHGYTMKTPEAVSCPPVKLLLDEPELITTIDTGYNLLYSITCLSDEEIWTHVNYKNINSTTSRANY